LASSSSAGKVADWFNQSDEYLTFPNRKILLMLEDPKQRKQIQMYLFGQSYEISITDDVENVAECIHRDPPDILILDSQLWEEDCLDLFQAIKQNQTVGNSQFLYMTTEEDLGRNLSRIEECVDDFLTEPFNIYELRARIKVLLKKKALLDRLFDSQANTIQHVITDQRTGLYNFEYCRHVLKHEQQRSLREHSKVSLVMMEVDERLVSQSVHEHPTEDPFFKELSDLIKKSIRKLDIASHRKDRTFAFVLPEADDEKTKGFIQRMIGLISSQLPAVKASHQSADRLFIFGHAVCPDDSDQLDELIQKADAALKKNKVSVKNSRVTTGPAAKPLKKRVVSNQTSRPPA
jgi:diguanylate cyclase (GGDEF)-like protein